MEDTIFPAFGETELSNQDAEQQWIKSIQKRVEELLSTEPGLLFSHLYRLDVEESHIQSILANTAPTEMSQAIAQEIWIRQKQRFQTKKDHPLQAIPEGWEW